VAQLEDILIGVWRQALVDGGKFVQIDSERYPVRTTSKRRLKQVDFVFEDKEIRGVEQNPLRNGAGRQKGDAVFGEREVYRSGCRGEG
jgi:hypothetical protein